VKQDTRPIEDIERQNCFSSTAALVSLGASVGVSVGSFVGAYMGAFVLRCKNEELVNTC